MSYCKLAPGLPYHREYHAKEYGFPLRGDDALFERLALEINQAGLSWGTILRKREGFRTAFDGFDVARVARYGRKDQQRLLRDPGIVRNRLKVEAVIENARRVLTLRETHGSFARWLDAHHPLSKTEWVTLFKQTFRFTGGEITGEFLKSVGYLAGAHTADCPVAPRVARRRPPWMRKGKEKGKTTNPDLGADSRLGR